MPPDITNIPQLKYIFEKPRYLSICVFGIAFILLANVATNSISFGMSVLDAAGKTQIEHHDDIVRAIAIAVATGSCIIHGVWRQGGIYINNILAVMKIVILLLIFILGMLASSGYFGPMNGAMKTHTSFSKFMINRIFRLLPVIRTISYDKYLTQFIDAKDAEGIGADAYGYAESFLAILFAWGGFNQANYVMGEIDDPRKRYKWPAFSAVAIVSTLYVLVNVAYFIVVPEEIFTNLATNSNVAHQFFLKTLGHNKSSPWAERAHRMLSAFMAISSLGNVIVMTYTAARVKQEIAKEGILPFRKFFASSVKSFRFSWWHSKKEALPEDIPLGALILHLIMSLILILATWKISAIGTYGLLVDLYSYAIDAIFGAFVGLGLVYMRLFSGRGWAKHSAASGFKIPSFVSTTCAFIYGIANLYPVAAKWVPPQSKTRTPTIPWYMTGLVSWTIMIAGVVWWIVFRKVVPKFGRSHKGRYLLVTRKLWFHAENEYKVLEYEDIDFRWPPREEGMEDTLLEETYNADDTEVMIRRHDDMRDRNDSNIS